MPPEPEPVSRKSVTLPDSTWQAIGEYRFYNRIPSEAEAIRQLINKGLHLRSLLDAEMAINEILTGRVKHYPGQFSGALSANALIDMLAIEVEKTTPSLRADEVQQKALAIYRNAIEEAGADADRARSLLNVNWRRYAD